MSSDEVLLGRCLMTAFTGLSPLVQKVKNGRPFLTSQSCHAVGCDPCTGWSVPVELRGHRSFQVFLEARLGGGLPLSTLSADLPSSLLSYGDGRPRRPRLCTFAARRHAEQLAMGLRACVLVVQICVGVQRLKSFKRLVSYKLQIGTIEMITLMRCCYKKTAEVKVKIFCERVSRS